MRVLVDILATRSRHGHVVRAVQKQLTYEEDRCALLPSEILHIAHH